MEYGPGAPVAFAPSSLQTKTLYTLLIVSSGVHATAKQLLYKHCLYIDSSERLQLLLCALTDPKKEDSSVPVLHCIKNMYLSPFPKKLAHTDILHLMHLVESIDDLPITKWIYELFCLVSPYLKRLVIDIPLRPVHPEDELLFIRPLLYNAFS